MRSDCRHPCSNSITRNGALASRGSSAFTRPRGLTQSVAADHDGADTHVCRTHGLVPPSIVGLTSCRSAPPSPSATRLRQGFGEVSPELACIAHASIGGRRAGCERPARCSLYARLSAARRLRWPVRHGTQAQLDRVRAYDLRKIQIPTATASIRISPPISAA